MHTYFPLFIPQRTSVFPKEKDRIIHIQTFRSSRKSLRVAPSRCCSVIHVSTLPTLLKVHSAFEHVCATLLSSKKRQMNISCDRRGFCYEKRMCCFRWLGPHAPHIKPITRMFSFHFLIPPKTSTFSNMIRRAACLSLLERASKTHLWTPISFPRTFS